MRSPSFEFKSLIKRTLGIRTMTDKLEYLKEFREPRRELDAIYKMRLEHVVRFDQPLVLISQIQRSGGTLLSQLFDGHPECHTHPYEILIGRPHKWVWPQLDVGGDPEDWFEKLFERPMLRLLRNGYRKPLSQDVFRFLFLPALQREIFLQCARSTVVTRQRHILDCYMTSYFNAWLDYRDLSEERRFLVGFTPRVHMHGDSLARYFADYPDGKLISIIRDPKGWHASARRETPDEHSNIESSIELWIASAQAMIENVRRYGDRVHIVAFTDLVSNTDVTMKTIAEAVGIQFHKTLLTPTFQNMEVRANSAFGVESFGIVKDVLDRSNVLSDEEKTYVDEKAGLLYETVLAHSRGAEV